MVRNSIINSYRKADSSEASYATPHRLVQMLMSGVLDGISNAKGAMMREQHEERHNDITWTITVIDALRGALDFEQGGEIAVNLDSLYAYMIRRLYEADIHRDAEALDEVGALLKEIKSGWDAMPDAIKFAENIKDVATAL